jgi:hypothetical protein
LCKPPFIQYITAKYNFEVRKTTLKIIKKSRPSQGAALFFKNSVPNRASAYLLASSTATAQATVAPTIGLLPIRYRKDLLLLEITFIYSIVLVYLVKPSINPVGIADIFSAISVPAVKTFK